MIVRGFKGTVLHNRVIIRSCNFAGLNKACNLGTTWFCLGNNEQGGLKTMTDWAFRIQGLHAKEMTQKRNSLGVLIKGL